MYSMQKSNDITSQLNGLTGDSTKLKQNVVINDGTDAMIKQNDNGCNHYTVDMRSDTISKPSVGMRKAMVDALVGDDVYGEDPTTNELEQRSARLFGMDAALFVSSGTMANLLAIMVHCSRRGTEAIVGDLSHTFMYEQGSAAQIAGVQLATIKNNSNGTFCLKEMQRKIRSPDLHEPITSLVIVENTHNMCGGKVLPLEWLQQLVEICKNKYSGIALHMDGARIFNAAEALNKPVDCLVKGFDSVCFCLSKGLSSAVGSVLVGSKDFIKEARRYRKALGGAMRQSGILAAGGLYALDYVVPKLGEDHHKTRQIAKAINDANSPNIQVDIDNVQSNILLVQIKNKKITASEFAKRLAAVTQKEIDDGILTDSNGNENENENKIGLPIVVKVSSRDWEFARIVLYQDITKIDTQLAIKKLNYVIREFDDLLQ